MDTSQSVPSSGPSDEALDLDEVRDAWAALSIDERIEALRLLPRADAEELFFNIPAAEQEQVVLAMPQGERRSWMRMLAPDDAADCIQAAERNHRDELLALLDDQTRREVTALLAYEEDAAGGLMNPRYARVRSEMTVDEALLYLRKQARGELELIYYAYVLDDAQRLIGTVSFRELFKAQPTQHIKDVMHTDVITAPEDLDQERLSRLFKQHELIAIPVVDGEGRMKGIVTVDDIVDVVEEEATEDMQKVGGMEALDAPYLSVSLGDMLKKRAGWLSVLFLGEMLTATAMAYFEDEIARAVVLALFVPLIISSGGNSGSQATTLVIRAMALGELRLRDWWRVLRREVASGLVLGAILGVIGFLRIIIGESMHGNYGEHYVFIALTVAGSLVGVVLFGTVAGSMLPLLLRRLKLDPASASAPFVATLVDVTGLVIYFSLAAVFLRGRLL